MTGPILVAHGYPGIAPLLLAELFILAPVGMVNALYNL